MAKWRKKPIVVEAFRWTGGEDQLEDPAWILDVMRTGDAYMANIGTPKVAMIIKTLEGDHRADSGDYIIKGIKGELYPCKPDIFLATYEPAE